MSAEGTALAERDDADLFNAEVVEQERKGMGLHTDSAEPKGSPLEYPFSHQRLRWAGIAAGRFPV